MCDPGNRCYCRRLKNRCYNCIRANAISTDILNANKGVINSLTTTSNFIPPVYINDPTPLPSAGSIWYNTTTMTLNYSNGTSVEVLQTTDPRVDLITRNNLVVTPNATLELIDNSIPADFPGNQDPTMTLVIPDCPIGRTKTFVLLSIGSVNTSANVFLTGNGISATLSPTGVVGVQSGTFIYAGDNAGWINIAASTPVPAIPSFSYPNTSPLPLSKTTALDKGKGQALDKGKEKGKEKLGDGSNTSIQQGFCVTLLGNEWLFVGCPYAGDSSNTGQVLVFRQDQYYPGFQNYYLDYTIIPDDAVGNSLFGSSIAALYYNGAAVVVIGGPGDNSNLGAAWIYKYNFQWSKTTKLLPPSQAGTGCQAGYSVAIGSYAYTDPNAENFENLFVIVGAPFTAGTGGVFVYCAKNNDSLTYVDTLFHRYPTQGSLFGYSVAAIDSSFNDSYGSIQKYGIYYFVGSPGYSGVWIMNAYLQVDGGFTFSYKSNEDGFIPSPNPSSLATTFRSLTKKYYPFSGGYFLDFVAKHKKEKVVKKIPPPVSVIGDTTASFGGITFDKNGFVHTVYQLPTGIDVGPTLIYTSQTVNPVDQESQGTDPPILLASTNLAAYWPIPAQPRNTISASPKIASDLTNNILYVVYTDAASTDSDEGALNMAINVVKSTDGGMTWNPTTPPRPLGPNSAFLPTISVDSTSGNVAVVWLDCLAAGDANDSYQAVAVISNDQGNTWGPLITLSPGLSSNSKHSNGYECGDYISADFYQNQLSVAWPDNSNTPQIPNPAPDPTVDLPMVIGFALVSVAGNQGTIQQVACASGSNQGNHFDCAIAINRTNPSNIAVSASQVGNTQQIYVASTKDGGITWTGFKAFDGTDPNLPQSYYANHMVSSSNGVLFLSYLADTVSDVIVASSADFAATNSFVLVKDLTNNQPRVLDLPFLTIASLSGNQYLGVVWQDISQGYSFNYAGYNPLAIPTKQYTWSSQLKCDTPSTNPTTFSPNKVFPNGNTLLGEGILPLGDTPVLNSIQQFGASLACNSNTLVVGAPSSTFTLSDGTTNTVGVVVVYTGVKNNWNKFGPFLYGTDYVNSPLQGSSVAISGDGQTILIGGPNDGVNQGTGACWLFSLSNNNYVVQGAGIRNANLVGNGRQGYAVALNSDGTTKIIGAPLDNNSAGSFFFS